MRVGNKDSGVRVTGSGEAIILKFDMPEESQYPPIRTNDPWTPPPPPLTRHQHRKYPGDEFVKAVASEEATVEAMVEDSDSYGTGAVL